MRPFFCSAAARGLLSPLLAIVAGLAGIIGCQKTPAPTADTAFALKVATLTVGRQRVEAEIADTAAIMQTGLMFRKTMPENHGMIFVFPNERQASFWMHNTDLPLDIAYLDRNGRLLEIHAAMPHNDAPIPSATANIAYALEMNQGWFQKHGIPIGITISGLPPFPARQ